MKTSARRPRTATINLSDFMRIQKEIIRGRNINQTRSINIINYNGKEKINESQQHRYHLTFWLRLMTQKRKKICL